MFWLRDNDYRVIALADAIIKLRKAESDSNREVAITFDDGFHDSFSSAVPVLLKLHYPATFFLVSGLMGRTNEWDRNTMLELSYRLMDWDDAIQLRDSGLDIGSHSVTHPVLPEIESQRAVEEIRTSKVEIEARLGITVRYFAYPYGRFDSKTRNMVYAAGYQAACSTLSGFANQENDPYALRRIEVFGYDSVATFRRKLEFGANEINSSQVLAYYVKRALSRLRISGC